MSRVPPKSLFVVAALSACAALVACEKKEEPKPVAPAASSLAPSVASPTSMVVKLKLDPKGSTKIDMPAPQEKIKAQTSAVEGHLDVDLMDVTQTRGEIKVDLTSLKTATFNDATKDGSQTAHALTWLEVADAAKGKLADDVKAQNKFATFAIRSIDGVSQKDLSKVTATPENGMDVRSVDLVAHGELLVHGHRVNKDIALTAKFSHPTGALASTKPKSLKIVSKEPFKVTLAEHEVRPRDEVGKIAKAAFSILGTKVADMASISVDFTAIPAE
jgi:hypothetical protein